MNILQFMRILVARRVTILVATISCFIGAMIVTLIVPPKWTATSSVILETLKPDPITGLVLGRSATVYIATQQALVTDFTVAGRVPDQLGWMTDPRLIQQYHARPSNDTRDFRHWLADNLIIQRTTATNPQGTNILQIQYAGTSPDNARIVADALRQSYLDASLRLRREAAVRNADWYAQQAQKVKGDLDDARLQVANYERANNLAMADERTDVDTVRLRALATQGNAPEPPQLAPAASSADIQLAQVNAELSQSLKQLGPNHPDVQLLREKQASLAKVAAAEDAKTAAAIAKAHSENANSVERAMVEQKSRVAGEQDKISILERLQSAANVLETEYEKAQAKAIELREEATASDAGITPLGAATVGANPDFPNFLLIIPGSIILGLGMGVGVGVLSELLARRVRGPEDLQAAIDAPVMGLISAPAGARRTLPRRPSNSLNWPSGRKAVQG